MIYIVAAFKQKPEAVVALIRHGANLFSLDKLIYKDIYKYSPHTGSAAYTRYTNI